MILSTTLIDSETKDYVLTYGYFQQSNELLTEAYSRINCPLGLYVIDLEFGSNIPLWINTRTKLTANTVINEINRTLTPLISSGRATVINIKVDSILTNGFSCSVNITDNNQKVWTLPVRIFNTKPWS